MQQDFSELMLPKHRLVTYFQDLVFCFSRTPVYTEYDINNINYQLGTVKSLKH